MSTQLEDRIRTTFHELADTTTVDPDARFGHRTAQIIEIRSDRRRWAMPAAAAAVAGLALIGGLITLARDDPAPASTAEQPLPEAQPVITVATPLYDGVPALFPAGESTSVFSTPQAAVGAYLTDRTLNDVLPQDLTGASPDDPAATGPKLPITFNLTEVDPTIVETGDPATQAAAVVQFSLQTQVDSGDGLALARQIAPSGEPEQWVVTAAGVASFGIDEVTFVSGRLTGSFTSEIGGRTEVMVFDAANGELLASAAVPDDAGMSLVDSPVPNTDLVVPAALGTFEFDGLSANTVTVRFWNTNAQPGGTPVAVFAETAVSRGTTVRSQGRAAVQQYVDVARPVFDDGPITIFADLGTTGSVLIFNDIVNRETDAGAILGEGVEITARRQDDSTPYCVDLVLADRNGSACFTFDQIARQASGFNMDSADGSLVLVGSVVTDAATSVIAPDGREIIPVGNIWYDLIPSSTGEPGVYTITAADGSTTTQQLG